MAASSVGLARAPGHRQPGRRPQPSGGAACSAARLWSTIGGGAAVDTAVRVGPTAVAGDTDQEQCTLYELTERTFQRTQTVPWGQKQTCGCRGPGDGGVRSWELAPRDPLEGAGVFPVWVWAVVLWVRVSASPLTGLQLLMLAVHQLHTPRSC